MFDIKNDPTPTYNVGVQSRLETEKKIKSFLGKPVGWHYGQGGPPSARRVAMALAYLSVLDALNLRQTDAFPGIDGEIMIRAYKDSTYFSLSIETNYMTTLSVDTPGDEDFEKEDLPISQAIALLSTKLKEILKRECDTRDWSIPSTTIEGQNPSLTMRLRTVPMEAVRPLSTRNAFSPAADLYASTLGTTTQMSPLIHQYSGYSTRLYSEALAA